MLFHPERLSKFKNDKNFAPISMEFSLCNTCNSNCIWCNDRSVRALYNGCLETDIILKALKSMKKYGVLAVTFEGGGEPTMHKDFRHILFKAYKHNFDIGLITNGINLCNFTYSVTNQCNWIRISLDAGSRDTYKMVHRTDRWDDVLHNIKQLISIKKLHKFNCKIGISYIIHRFNYNEIYSTTKLMKSIGVDYIQFKPLIENNRFIYYKKANKYLNCAKRLKNDKFKVYISGDNAIKKDYNCCYAHRFSGQIDASGNVNVCCNLGHRTGLNFGNLHNKSFKRIWKSSKRKQIMKQIENSEFLKTCPVCRFHSTNMFLNKIKNKSSNNFI